MKILIDTNILIRSAQSDHPDSSAALEAVDRIILKGDIPCLVPQNLYEFWVVATRPRDQNGLGFSVEQSSHEVALIKRLITLLRDERVIVREWERLVVQYRIQGKRAHDTRLVAAMIRHGISSILTFNERDFMSFPEISVLTPQAILNS